MRISLLLFALFLALGLTQCTPAFNAEWKQAMAAGAPQHPTDITGPWMGTWVSEGNGHHGELRCLVSSSNGKTGECRFRYCATFLNTLSASYDVTHIVKRTPQGFAFSGDQTLTGLGGGLYHYEGKATTTHFRATYRSEADHGVFEMDRPTPKP